MRDDVVRIDIDGFELRVICECLRYVNNDAAECLLESMEHKGEYTPEEVQRVEKVAIDTYILFNKLEEFIV